MISPDELLPDFLVCFLTPQSSSWALLCTPGTKTLALLTSSI